VDDDLKVLVTRARLVGFEHSYINIYLEVIAEDDRCLPPPQSWRELFRRMIERAESSQEKDNEHP
jgi:hypothetical protein